MNRCSHKLSEHELRLFSWVSEFHLSYVTYLVLILPLKQYWHENKQEKQTWQKKNKNLQVFLILSTNSFSEA